MISTNAQYEECEKWNKWEMLVCTIKKYKSQFASDESQTMKKRKKEYIKEKAFTQFNPLAIRTKILSHQHKDIRKKGRKK